MAAVVGGQRDAPAPHRTERVAALEHAHAVHLHRVARAARLDAQVVPARGRRWRPSRCRAGRRGGRAARPGTRRRAGPRRRRGRRARRRPGPCPRRAPGRRPRPPRSPASPRRPRAGTSAPACRRADCPQSTPPATLHTLSRSAATRRACGSRRRKDRAGGRGRARRRRDRARRFPGTARRFGSAHGEQHEREREADPRDEDHAHGWRNDRGSPRGEGAARARAREPARSGILSAPAVSPLADFTTTRTATISRPSAR